MHEAWSSLLRPIVGPPQHNEDIREIRPSQQPSASAPPPPPAPSQITIPNEISPTSESFKPFGDSTWRRTVVTAQALTCSDTGGFDIELPHPLYPQYVVGSATDRVWVYNRHRRVKFNSDPTVLGGRVEKSPTAVPVSHHTTMSNAFSPVDHRAALDALSVASGSTHDKVLLHDPPTSPPPPRSATSRGSSLIRQERSIRRKYPTLTRLPAASMAASSPCDSLPSPDSPGPRRKYFYVGETYRGRRHGWGRLASEDRVIYEGSWQHGRALGHYIAYHQFHVEMGFQSAWHRVAVFILGDSHASVVPVALDRYPLMLRGEKRQKTLLQRSECLPEPDESLYLSHGDCRKIPHNTVAPNLWFSQASTISKSFEWDKPFDNGSQLSAASDFVPRKRFTRMPTTLYRGGTDPEETEAESENDTASRLGGGLARCSSNESSSTDQSSPCVMRIEHSLSLNGSHCYSCKASSTDAGSTLDYSAAARPFPRGQPAGMYPLSRTCPCRRGSFPAAVPALGYGLSEASLASLTTPDGPRECPITDHMNTRWHRRVIASLHHAAPGSFRAADFANWTTAHLCLFLAAVGAFHAVEPIRRYRIRGDCVQKLTYTMLMRMGVSDANTRRFLVACFRYLFNGVDRGDPLGPRSLRQAHPKCYPLATLDEDEISLTRRLGAGGHALVFLGHINRGPSVALKVFATARNRRGCRVPVSNRPLTKDESSHTSAVSTLRLSCSAKYIPQPLGMLHVDRLDLSRGRDTLETVCNGGRSRSPDESPGLTGRTSMSPLQVLATVKGWFGMSSSTTDCSSGGNAKNVPAITVAAVETPPTDRQKWPMNETSGDGGAANIAEEHRSLHPRKSTALRMRDHEVSMMELIAPHPNVLKAIGSFSLPGDLPGLAVDLCPLGALDSRLTPDARSPHASKGKLQWPQIIEIFQDIARGMAHIHSLGIYHRDLKPSNFLISNDGKGKISDFGMAISFRAGRPTPVFLASYGCVYYAAPEVLRGEGFWPESDVFSYGVSFWEALTGRPVHEGLTRGEIICIVATGKAHYKPPSLLRPSLSSLLSRMVAFDRRDRPSFREIADTISALKEEKAACALDTVRAFMGI